MHRSSCIGQENCSCKSNKIHKYSQIYKKKHTHTKESVSCSNPNCKPTLSPTRENSGTIDHPEAKRKKKHTFADTASKIVTLLQWVNYIHKLFGEYLRIFLRVYWGDTKSLSTVFEKRLPWEKTIITSIWWLGCSRKAMPMTNSFNRRQNTNIQHNQQFIHFHLLTSSGSEDSEIGPNKLIPLLSQSNLLQ